MISTEFNNRWKRFFRHITFVGSELNPKIRHWFDWPIDLTFMIFDLFWILDMIQSFVRYWPFSRFRTLNAQEKELVNLVFRDEETSGGIRIREKVNPLFSGYFHAFVFLRNIYCVKEIQMDVFTHELIHVWQRKKYGSAYIYRALKAQRMTPSYAYGGLNKLKQVMRNGLGLEQFNFEQQAQLFQDLYNLQQKGRFDEEIWDYYVSLLRK